MNNFGFCDRVATFRPPGRNVVFVRNNKCASTFYSNIFTANGWVTENLSTVDWSHDRVFSVISDPYVRYVKGLVQDLCDRGLERVTLSMMGRTFWHSLPWIGDHSMPVSVKFDGYCDRIDWIPIDAKRLGEEIITDLLRSHDVTVDWSIPVFRNESDDYKKKLFHEVSDRVNCEEKQQLLARDYELYHQAIMNHK